jgi:hypothetical protein
VAFPTVTTVLDTFDRIDNTVLGASWTTYITSFTGTRDGRIISNASTGDNNTTLQQNYWNGATYGPDAEVFVTLTTLPATDADSVDLYIRLTTIGSGTTDGYSMRWTKNVGDDTVEIRRIDNGTAGVIAGPIACLLSAGDKIGFSAVGSDITAWRTTAGVWGSALTVSDATYNAAGHMGHGVIGFSVRIDDFAGGTTVGATAFTTSPVGVLVPSGLETKKVTQTPLGALVPVGANVHKTSKTFINDL